MAIEYDRVGRAGGRARAPLGVSERFHGDCTWFKASGRWPRRVIVMEIADISTSRVPLTDSG